MTNTTTDAAEARAREVLEIGKRFLAACNSAWACGEPYHRVKTMMDRAEEFQKALDMYGVYLATAEAASGAGEREAGEPTLAREIAAQFFDRRDPLDRSFRDIAHNIRRGRCDDQDSVEIVRFTLAFVAREAASLPPATDPAMVTVPKEPPEAFLDMAPNYMMSRASMAILWRDMLAAAPTILATGGGRTVSAATDPMFAAIREQIDTRDDRIQLLECALATVVVNLLRSPEKAQAVATFASAVIRGSSLQDAANEAEKAGDPTSIVEATIPVTGHAATEGEGA